MNGYSLFVEETRRRYPEYRSKSNGEMFAIANTLWVKLTQEQKKGYNTRAKNRFPGQAAMVGFYKGDGQETGLDPRGRQNAFLQNQKREEQEKVDRRRGEVEAWVGKFHDRLSEVRVVVLEFSHWLADDRNVFPAEIALLEFSIGDGPTRYFSEIVAPESFPLGTRFSVIQKAEKTHQIPLDHEDLNLDVKEVVKQIKHFLGHKTSTSLFFESCGKQAVFIRSENRALYSRTLDWLFKQEFRGQDWSDVIGLYDLEEFLFYASNSLKPESCPTFNFASICVEFNDKFFTLGYACENFHEGRDVENTFCALARARICASNVAEKLYATRKEAVAKSFSDTSSSLVTAEDHLELDSLHDAARELSLGEPSLDDTLASRSTLEQDLEDEEEEEVVPVKPPSRSKSNILNMLRGINNRD